MFLLKSVLILVLLWKSSEAAYTAEGYFVVDHKTIQKYMNERTETDPAVRKQKATEEITKDIDYFLTELNELYLSMGPRGLDIEIRSKKVDILGSDIFSPGIIYLGDQVDENIALSAFDSWIDNTRANVSVGFDFAVLWTGYNLRGSIAANSHFGTACTTRATSVTEFDGTYQVVHNTAQMIARILGASFDGIASTNVMSQFLDPNNRNRWSFSVCTATDIIDFINTLNRPSCLEISSASVKPSVTPDSYTGQLLNPEVVCKRRSNSSASYMCKGTIYNGQLPKGDNVCSYLYCYEPGTDNMCWRAYSSDGIICDVGKRCQNGLCQVSDSPATRNVDAFCLWGDEAVIYYTNPAYDGNCNGFIQRYGLANCYDSSFYTTCCTTCKGLNTGIQGCEYGDTNSDCTKYTQASICTSDANRKVCCNYCKNYPTKRSVNNYIPVTIKPNLSVLTVKKSKVDSAVVNEYGP